MAPPVRCAATPADPGYRVVPSRSDAGADRRCAVRPGVILGRLAQTPVQAIGKRAGGDGAGVIDRLAREVGKYGREVWPMVAMHWANQNSFLTMAAHFESSPSSAAEMRATPVDARIPVTVLTAESAVAAETIAPHGRYVTVAGSGHWIHLDQPDLVMEEVLALLAAARASARTL